MKRLALHEILSVVEGRIISGNHSKLIENVAKYGEHLITKDTLVFVPDKKRAIPLPDVFPITVITSTPSLLKNIREDTTVIHVSNAKKAYMKFISFYRNLFTLPVIGVTGTSGKTTTKEMITWILSEKQHVVSTYLSHNGLRRNLDYLLKIDDTTDSAVFEMGVSGPNQLLYSAFYFRPQIGIITTIGTDHIEGFKNQDAYVKEKTNMLKAVSKNGTIILNQNDATCRNIDTDQFEGTVLFYGTDQMADFQAQNISFNIEKGGMDFTLVCSKGEFACFVPGFGTHNVYNALAAIIASSLAGVTVPDAINRLQTYTPVKSHLQFYDGVRGSMVIDDTWNTNPSSIAAALEVLKETANGRKTIAILGEIEELGDYSVTEHEKVGALVAEQDIDVLITIGKQARPICRKAIDLGMDPSSIHNVGNQSELLKILHNVVDGNTSILLKTSMRKSFKDTLTKLIKKG